MSMPFPPFDPEQPGAPRRKRSFGGVPFRILAPNMLTLLALCAGLTSIRMSIEGRFDLAIAAIVFAALLDAVDGRIARLLKSSSRFGAELDSLADFVNFGVANMSPIKHLPCSVEHLASYILRYLILYRHTPLGEPRSAEKPIHIPLRLRSNLPPPENRCPSHHSKKHLIRHGPGVLWM
jgi:hypothetical protein